MPTRRTFAAAGAALFLSKPAWAWSEQPRAPQAPADGRDPPLTRASLEALKAQCSTPALAAAAQRRGAATKLWATGLRMAGADAKVTSRDAWHIGSISKSFLATLAGRLVDQGRLRWDDTLGAALAQDFPNMPAPFRDATLIHLMSHRAGFIDNLPLDQMRAFDISPDPERTQRHAFLQSAFALPPVAMLGAKTVYSNVGYVAAAAMIEARTGASWETLMRREVFEPLNLRSAGFGPPGRAGILEEPVGHGEFFGQPYRPHPLGQPNSDLPLVMAPAGRIHLNLGDLITYLAAHRDQTPLLAAATWRVLHTPHSDGEYALGWNTWPDGSYTHDGGNLLWYAIASFNPKTGIAATAAANDGGATVFGPVGEAVRQAIVAVRGVG
jgi:CubicO group peptidase (beta-lactamase class C family)